jgi:hypothetical protein
MMSKSIGRACAMLLATAGFSVTLLALPAAADEPLKSETPASFVPRVDTFDYV